MLPFRVALGQGEGTTRLTIFARTVPWNRAAAATASACVQLRQGVTADPLPALLETRNLRRH